MTDPGQGLGQSNGGHQSLLAAGIQDALILLWRTRRGKVDPTHEAVVGIVDRSAQCYLDPGSGAALADQSGDGRASVLCHRAVGGITTLFAGGGEDPSRRRGRLQELVDPGPLLAL